MTSRHRALLRADRSCIDLDVVEAVRDLNARYVDAINRWDPEMLGDCFTQYALWDVKKIARAEGRAEVVEAIDSARQSFDWVYQVLNSLMILDHDDRSAHARAYATEYSSLRGEGTLFFGVYHDECMCDDGVWRYARRTVDVLYMGRIDLSVPPLQYPAPTRSGSGERRG